MNTVQVTFTVEFAPSPRDETEHLPPAQSGSLTERIHASIYRKLQSLRNDTSRILSGVTVQDDSIRYHYLNAYSIEDHAPHIIFIGEGMYDPFYLNRSNWEPRVREITYKIRNGMLYQNSSFCEEWWQGFTSSLWLPVFTLVRKVCMPIIIFIMPCSCTSDYVQQLKWESEIVANLPLKALAGLVGQLCLSILWCITLGLTSEWVNHLRGDIERWENGHTNQVGATSRITRISSMPYCIPNAQPITTYNAERVRFTPEGKVDLMTTECIPNGQRKLIVQLIASSNQLDFRNFTLPITENLINSIYQVR